jgi:hypothetical protein
MRLKESICELHFVPSFQLHLNLVLGIGAGLREFTNVKQVFRQQFDACVNNSLLKYTLCKQTFRQFPHRNG